MASPQRLDVYLGAERVGELERGGPTRYRLRYVEEAVERHGVGGALLSASLPVRRDPYPSGVTKPFFEGLLPEGAIRAAVARTLGLSEDNGFGLLAELGADCAGAVVILPPGTEPTGAGPSAIRWLDDEQLAERIADLPRHPLGVSAQDRRVRLSLAGVQPKLVVVRAPSGRVGLPIDGAPSTHLIKPAQDRYPDLVENEAFCLRVAACAGLRVASAEVLELRDLRCLLVERWDRTIADDGRVARLHQEDFCQALGLLPSAKYEAEGGPSAAAMVALLRELGGPTLARDLNELVRAIVLNLVLGNSDAHGKNLALLYEPLGLARLAPLYDLVSTAAYPELHGDLAMTIGGVAAPDDVDEAAWRRLAADCGLGAPQLVRSVRDFGARVAQCARAVRDMARAEGWYRPLLDEIVALAERRAPRLAG